MAALFGIDAFTDRPFSGNPAAVCLLDAPPPDAWAQLLAAEMNLSETAFVFPHGEELGLRWFTPVAEVDLCGHATLAAAFALWTSGRRGERDPIVFHTRSGVLGARMSRDWIELDFPAEPPRTVTDAQTLAVLHDIVSSDIEYAGVNRMDHLVQVRTEEAVRTLRPDLVRLRGLSTRGLIVTGPSRDPAFDFVSRFFAPAVGVDEDPVTGSAHCALGPFWSSRLGKDAMVGYQASRRGGSIRVRLKGDRVFLGGKAVSVWQGTVKDPS